MIKDTKIVDLAAYKRKKEEEELADLRERVNELIEQYADELEPKMYPSIFEDDALGTIDWFSGSDYLFDPIKYTPTGITTHADIVLEPNVASCAKTLAWVSYLLSDMGMKKASDMVEDVIAVLDSEDNA